MKQLFGLIAVAVISLPLMGCPSQTTIADLVSTLGTASSSLAAIEGNATLATQLKTDTAAAATAVLNWKAGTSSTLAVEAMNVVMADLNLIPAAAPYTALIDLALTTGELIIAELHPTTATVPYSKVPLKSKKDFTNAWNAIVNNDPKLKSLVLK